MKFSYDGKGINDANDEYKTRLLTFNFEHVKDDERNEIGRLIEAAPDMLAALELLINGELNTRPKVNHAVSVARAAIAKAKGETK